MVAPWTAVTPTGLVAVSPLTVVVGFEGAVTVEIGRPWMLLSLVDFAATPEDVGIKLLTAAVDFPVAAIAPEYTAVTSQDLTGQAVGVNLLPLEVAVEHVAVSLQNWQLLVEGAMDFAVVGGGLKEVAVTPQDFVKLEVGATSFGAQELERMVLFALVVVVVAVLTFEV